MGVLGFILVGAGALTVWAGFQGVNVLDVVRSVLAGEELPTTKPSAPGKAAGTSPAKQPADDDDDDAKAKAKAKGKG